VTTMSPDEKAKFTAKWGKRKEKERPEKVPSLRKLERLKDEMTAKQGAIDFHTAQYVQAALAYGVELTRSEYRTLANRNWKIIQKFGVTTVRIMVLFVIAGITLGILQLKATTTANNAVADVQKDRHHSIIEKCKSGKAFDAKLKLHIATLPEPEKKETVEQVGFTEELVSTVVPVTPKECAIALKLSGFDAPTTEELEEN
jgi:hypothetical protein